MTRLEIEEVSDDYRQSWERMAVVSGTASGAGMMPFTALEDIITETVPDKLSVLQSLLQAEV